MALQNFTPTILKPNSIVNQYSWFSINSMYFPILSIRTPIEPFRSSTSQHSPLRFRQSKSSGMIRKYRPSGFVQARTGTESSIYDFTVKDIDKKDVSLSKFKGKVILIVNVASKCGLTTSNYSELSGIYDKYKTQGFDILAFPCNQFGGQEPASNPEIKQFACSRFKAEFPIFDKIDVNGSNTAPVYQFLKSSSGGFLGELIKWNFEKFLLDKNGKVFQRYPPTTSPYQIENDIKKLLG